MQQEEEINVTAYNSEEGLQEPYAWSPLSSSAASQSPTKACTMSESFLDEVTDYPDYAYNAGIKPPPPKENGDKIALAVINALISILGLCGNGMVIWIAGFKMKRTVITTWYLSLAFSDFIFCAVLPFSIHQISTNKWIFGLFMCKFTSFSLFLNQFSSILLMAVISADRCLTVLFPVWSQNHRTVRKAAFVVVLAWVISMALSVPSLVFRQTKTDFGVTKCFNNFTLGAHHSGTSLPVARFVVGFVLPLIVITVCYSVIILKLRNDHMTRSSKPFKIMTALIVMFLVSWLPYHIFTMLEINYNHSTAVHLGQKIAVTLATSNSCMNPFLYAFMGKQFTQKVCASLMAKIESAFHEEASSTKKESHSLSKKSTSL